MRRLSLAACLFASITVAHAQEAMEKHKAPVTEIRQSAVAFLEGLSPELREQATFTLDDKERRAWSNLPATSFKREGISFKEMSPEQRSLAHQLLQSTLSSQGYLKTTGIMHLDEILKSLAEKRRPNDTPMFGHDLYWIGIFGDPAKDDSWRWQLDGHHLALNITVVGDEVSVQLLTMEATTTYYKSGNQVSKVVFQFPLGDSGKICEGPPSVARLTTPSSIS